MKAAVTLFEFMPYGAPELLQSHRERLASSLVISSIAIAASFVAIGALARLIVVPPIVITAPPGRIHVVETMLEVSLPPPPVLTVTPHARPPDVTGVPVPVPAEPDVPLVHNNGSSTDPGTPGPSVEGTRADVSSLPPGDEPLPAPDQWVWAEQYPVAVTEITPEYPEIGREAGVEGLVVVKVLVGKNGRVLDVRLDEKHQVPLLNEAALGAARRWVFTPALANGRPVAVWTAIPFHFRLH
jgi:periplasmic protein TonB